MGEGQVSMSAINEHPLLHAARSWFDAGFAVVPSHEDGGKRPFGPWKEYQSQRPAWSQVQQWMDSGRFTGIGVLSGGASGNVELIEIEGPIDLAIERLGKVFAAASTTFAACGVDEVLKEISRGCVEQSAGGGLHLFIRVSDGPALGNTKLATVDGKVVAETRGEGGFVVVAPTPGRNGHAEGASYIFINGGSPEKIVNVTVEQRDMLHMLFAGALNTDVHVVEQREQRPALTVAYEGTSAFDDYRERMSWKDILEPAGWTFSHSDSQRDYWTRPGKTTHEGISASTITDGPLVNFSSSVSMPSNVGLSKAMVYAHLHHSGDLSAAARVLGQDGFGSAAPSRDIPAWEAILDPDATDIERQESQASWVRDRLPLLDWEALWADETEEEWLVKPLLAKRRLVALYSAPKVGKSLLMLEIAAGLASGRKVLGNPARDTIKVLYVDFENDPRGDIRRRLEDMNYSPIDLGNLCYLTFPTLGALDSEKGSQELAAAVDEYECQVVVIDTVSRAIEGDENENDTWLSFYRHTGLKLKRRGIAMIRLDHSGKDESKGQRGGSAKSGDVDAVWRMSRLDEDNFELICEAKRFPIAEERMMIKREEGPLRHDLAGASAQDKTNLYLTWMSDANLIKDPKRKIADVHADLRAEGHKFKNIKIDREIYLIYCNMLGSWAAPTLDAGVA